MEHPGAVIRIPPSAPQPLMPTDPSDSPAPVDAPVWRSSRQPFILTVMLVPNGPLHVVFALSWNEASSSPRLLALVPETGALADTSSHCTVPTAVLNTCAPF